jgi:hypothetical protein
MSEQVSLKLCLLTSITEETGEEVENEVLISNPKNNGIPCQIRSGDKQNLVSGGTPTTADSEEA